jgi:type II secretory pathway component PulF
MKKVTGAMVYPAIVLTMGLTAVLVLSLTLFKQMKECLRRSEPICPLLPRLLWP